MVEFYVQYRNRDGNLRWTDCMLLSADQAPLQYVPQFVRNNAVKIERLGIVPNQYNPYNPYNPWNPYQYSPALGCYR